MCDTSAFTPNVPGLIAALNSGCSNQHMLNLHFPIVAADSAGEVFTELVKCAVINSDQAVGKTPLMFLILQTEDCESHQHISPKQNTKQAIVDGSGK